MSTWAPTILGIATWSLGRSPRTLARRRFLTALLFALFAATPAAFAQAPAPVDDSSQSVDLDDYRKDRAVIDDSSQAADLGNDRADWATITDESQEADLH